MVLHSLDFPQRNVLLHQAISLSQRFLKNMSCQNPQLSAFILLFTTGTEIKTVLPKPTCQLQRPAHLTPHRLQVWEALLDCGSPPDCVPERPHDIRGTFPRKTDSSPHSKTVLFHQRRPRPVSGAQVRVERFDRSRSMINQVSLLSWSVEHVLILTVPHQLTGRILKESLI